MEGSRRVGDRWTVNLEARKFQGIASGDPLQSVTWRTSLVWVKQENGWKVAHNHVSALFPDLQDKSS